MPAAVTPTIGFVGSLQGASRPPLIGKRASRFLDTMKRVQESQAVVMNSLAGRVPLDGMGPGKTRKAWTGSGSSAMQKEDRRWRKHNMGRRRVEKWTVLDRDLAEHELAAVIVEQQQVKIDVPAIPNEDTTQARSVIGLLRQGLGTCRMMNELSSDPRIVESITYCQGSEHLAARWEDALLLARFKRPVSATLRALT